MSLVTPTGSSRQGGTRLDQNPWTSIQSPGNYGAVFPGKLPSINDVVGRRQFIWNLARFANPSLDDIRLQNIHACAELSAFRFAASKGWTTITDGVVEFLIDLHIWTSQFPDIVLPWEGHAQTGDLRIQGQSQAYNRWLHVNQHALYAPYDWSSVEHPHAFGEDANIVHLRRSPSFVTGRRVHFPQLIFSPTSLLGIFRGMYQLGSGLSEGCLGEMQ